jgi:hypothetical protein
MPDHIGLLGKRNAKGFALSRIIEQAEFNFFGVLGIEGEVDALSIPSGAQGIRTSGPNDRLKWSGH